MNFSHIFNFFGIFCLQIQDKMQLERCFHFFPSLSRWFWTQVKILTAPVIHKMQKYLNKIFGSVKHWDVSLKPCSDISRWKWHGFSQLWNMLLSLLALLEVRALQAWVTAACHTFFFSFCSSCCSTLLLAPCQHSSFTASLFVYTLGIPDLKS